MHIKMMIGPDIEMNLSEFANELRARAEQDAGLGRTILLAGADDIDAMVSEKGQATDG